jgi:hypothetical protein
MRRLRSRPKPALVIATLSLVAALAGTAVAGSDVQSSAVSKKKVKKIARKQATKQINKLAPGLSVLNAENATNSDQLDNLNSTDFRRSNDVIGASDLGTIRQRSSAPTNVAPGGSLDSARRQCNPGEQVLTGGNDFTGTDAAIVASRFEPPNGWVVFLRNDAGSGDATITTHVYCLQP